MRIFRQTKRRKKRSNEESQICRALWTWFFYEYRAERDCYLRIEVGQHTKVQQALLKAEGAKAGMSDVLIALPRGGFHGFWLEVKKDKGRASQDQKNFHQLMMNQGYYCAFGYGLDDCKHKIIDYVEGKIERVLPNKAMRVKD